MTQNTPVPSGSGSMVRPSAATLLASSTTPERPSRPPSSRRLKRRGISSTLTEGSCMPRTSGGRPVMLARAVISTWALVPSRKELNILVLMVRRSMRSSSKP